MGFHRSMTLNHSGEVNVKILVVEDERGLNQMIRDYLSALGFEVSGAYDGLGALDRAKEGIPDLIVLDLQLPGLDGLDVARRLRQGSNVPIIMLTARADEADKLIGLEIGADDYLTKPFSLKELAARIRTVLRRVRTGTTSIQDDDTVLTHLDLRLDPSKRSVTKDGVVIPLTAVQFNIMRLFMRNPGQVFTRLRILEAAEGINNEGYERTIDVHIKNLRKAIEADPSQPRYLLTVWGVGYKLTEAPRSQGEPGWPDR